MKNYTLWNHIYPFVENNIYAIDVTACNSYQFLVAIKENVILKRLKGNFLLRSCFIADVMIHMRSIVCYYLSYISLFCIKHYSDKLAWLIYEIFYVNIFIKKDFWHASSLRSRNDVRFHEAFQLLQEFLIK